MSTDPKFRKCLTFDNKPMLLEIWDLTWFSCDEDSEGHAVVYFLSMLFSLIMRYRVKNRLRRTRCPATTGFSESFNSYHMFSPLFSDFSYCWFPSSTFTGTVSQVQVTWGN